MTLNEQGQYTTSISASLLGNKKLMGQRSERRYQFYFSNEQLHADQALYQLTFTFGDISKHTFIPREGSLVQGNRRDTFYPSQIGAAR